MAWYETLPSGKVRARLQLPDGTRISQTWPTRRLAMAWAAEQERELARGTWIDPAGSEILTGDWLDRWAAARTVERSTSAADASRLRTHLRPRWDGVPLGRISRLAVQQWVNELARTGLSAKTIKECHALLYTALRDAQLDRLIPHNPCERVQLPAVRRERPRALLDAEVTAILAGLGGVARAVVEVDVGTGLRWGELTGLTGRRVNLLQRRLEVVEVLAEVGGHLAVKAYPKTSAGRRTVPLTDRLCDVMEPLVRAAGPSGPVFPAARGGLLRRSWRDRVWLPAVEAAEVSPRPRFHDCRHTFISRLVASGMPLPDVMVLAGHSNIATTMAYTHVSEDMLERARQLLDRGDSVGKTAADDAQIADIAGGRHAQTIC